jgi:cyclomaltodextrinase / maltogenic alpha-amylase / neopullulanase
MVTLFLLLFQSAQPPIWAQEATWYQIFVERFHNGDPHNDPTLESIRGSWPHLSPEGWSVTPWTHDWYAMDPWAEAADLDFYTAVQLRRYGGDLQGLIDKLDYLADLGITAIYLNPLNDAPSLHKYDARHYHHIDVHFGPDPAADKALIAGETPDDPSTWVWTHADRLFLRVISEAHARGIRVVLDVSWNHTGQTFWAWKDVVAKGRASRFADWYEIESFEPFRYSGWAGVPELPELRKIGAEGRVHGRPVPGNLHEDVKRHIFDVTRRWMDPNGDGDPSDGVDGFRLDVAELVPIEFWREYRRFVTSINPDAFLVGEVWWDVWPDRMIDPGPWVGKDVFDAVMNYRWYMPTRSFFADALPQVRTASEYVMHLDSISRGQSLPVRRAMMNLAASHDSERFGTSILNRGNRYKYRMSPRETETFRVDKPDAWTLRLQRLILAHQFTYIGAPHIWNGDELGMWGGDDPDMRKPIIWPELNFEDEVAHPFGRFRKRDTVKADTALHAYHKALIAIRRRNPALVWGDLQYKPTADPLQSLAYLRSHDGNRILVVFHNRADDGTLAVDGVPIGSYTDLLDGSSHVPSENGRLLLPMEGKSARILRITSPTSPSPDW